MNERLDKLQVKENHGERARTWSLASGSRRLPPVAVSAGVGRVTNQSFAAANPEPQPAKVLFAVPIIKALSGVLGFGAFLNPVPV
jgi:hypothetical protein